MRANYFMLGVYVLCGVFWVAAWLVMGHPIIGAAFFIGSVVMGLFMMGLFPIKSD